MDASHDLAANLIPEPAPEPTLPPTRSAGLEYARRVYDRVIDWYKVAEAKSQLLLTVNGAFAAVFFGFASSNVSDLRHLGHTAGVETWCFLTAAVVAFCGAVGLGAAGLLSRHRHNINADFARLGVRKDDPSTYRVEAAWYFGHLAMLDFEPAVNLLRRIDQDAEIEVLTYNVVGLSHVVLRKHRLVNAGWLLTAGAIVAMIATTMSIILRS